MKKVFLVALLSTFGFLSNAQSYHHGFGFQYSYAAFTSPGFTDVASTPGFFYKSTLGFDTKGPDFGISIYPYVGVMIQDGEGSLGAELPIMAELYLKDIDDKCFQIGIGYSFSYWYTGWTASAIIGPKVALGGQFRLKDKLVGLRAGFVHGMNNKDLVDDFGQPYKLNKNLFDIGLYFVIGG